MSCADLKSRSDDSESPWAAAQEFQQDSEISAASRLKDLRNIANRKQERWRC